MRTHRNRGGAAARVAIAASVTLALLTRLRAEEGPVAVPDGSTLSAPLAVTEARGAATVAVFTSADEPGSARLWQEFSGADWVRGRRGLVQVVNVTKEGDPDAVRGAGVVKFPTVVVFGRGPNGVTRLA